MGKRDPRVDAYIASAAPFAQPILAHFRSIVHSACPEVIEAIKWGNVSFEHQGLMCGMAAFKNHCIISFWKASLLNDDAASIRQQVESLKDLPNDKTLTRLIKQAAKLNEGGVAVERPPRPKTPAKPIKVPDYFLRAIRANKKAQVTFEAFSPSHKKEYVEWITEAKTDETRERRIETAIEWMAEGKPRNWKYMNR
jgi:uncharacterized protein YdeI (YjbR/CyaY-like superfamily)